MNPLWPPSSSSRQVRAGNGRVGKGTAEHGRGAPAAGRGAPAAALAGRFGAVAGAAAAPTDDGSSQTAAASPTLPNLEAGCLPAWWTSSSPMASSEGWWLVDCWLLKYLLQLVDRIWIPAAHFVATCRTHMIATRVSCARPFDPRANI